MVSIILFVAGASPFVLMAFHGLQSDESIKANAQEIHMMSNRSKASELAKARSYNSTLASSGQPVLGDPYPSETVSYPKEYTDLLKNNRNTMAVLRIPSISLQLPIGHGTSSNVLDNGLGYVYGSSLPVGGASSRSIIAGHRGKPSSLLFTRIDELGKGDSIMVDVMGETLYYKVTSIAVIEPNEIGKLKIQKGKDMITLLTCTPYGVNTQRLIVNAERSNAPSTQQRDTIVESVRNGIMIIVSISLIAVCRYLIRTFYMTRMNILTSFSTIQERLL